MISREAREVARRHQYTLTTDLAGIDNEADALILDVHGVSWCLIHHPQIGMVWADVESLNGAAVIDREDLSPDDEALGYVIEIHPLRSVVTGLPEPAEHVELLREGWAFESKSDRTVRYFHPDGELDVERFAASHWAVFAFKEGGEPCHICFSLKEAAIKVTEMGGSLW